MKVGRKEAVRQAGRERGRQESSRGKERGRSGVEGKVSTGVSNEAVTKILSTFAASCQYLDRCSGGREREGISEEWRDRGSRRMEEEPWNVMIKKQKHDLE